MSNHIIDTATLTTRISALMIKNHPLTHILEKVPHLAKSRNENYKTLELLLHSNLTSLGDSSPNAVELVKLESTIILYENYEQTLGLVQ